MSIALRRAVKADALCLGVLATQVFLDTYATDGVRADLAREVLGGYSPEAFARRLGASDREIHLAEHAGALVGYVEVALGRPCPVPVEAPASEMAQLYIQRPFQRRGLGARLMRHAEALAREAGSRTLWLDAWVGNAPALSFYAAMGYKDVGRTDHVIEGQSYENRVFARPIA